jgi:hypothetical protein
MPVVRGLTIDVPKQDYVVNSITCTPTAVVIKTKRWAMGDLCVCAMFVRSVELQVHLVTEDQQLITIGTVDLYIPNLFSKHPYPCSQWMRIVGSQSECAGWVKIRCGCPAK